ncbi:MAG: oxidoreductase [Acidimicrobiia bacterium]|nr:MAG: oxidoreductase [Acidimicrobiia bacterium]
MTRIAVVGTDHFHVAELTARLRDAGGEIVAVVPTEGSIGPWLASQHPGARTDRPYDDDVDLVVTAAIPSERAAIAIEAMRAGKDVVADKPGATSHDQLGALRAACEQTGRRYTVVFSERLGAPAMTHAHAIAASGRIGTVVHTVGLGPHTLALDRRPQWFFDPARYGGILVDIGSHQVDQFLAFTGATDAAVVASTVRAHDDHPGVEVIGEMLLEAGHATGYARVDYLTPAGLGAWGDVRFTVVGTDGFLEVRHVDQTVTVVDGERRETIECAGGPVTWADQVLAGSPPVTQEHVFTVTRICLEAQERARRLPRPGGLIDGDSKGRLT